jgi:hypothetical protein
MAHKECFEAYSADDKRRDRAVETVTRLNAQIGAMTIDRDAAQAVIDELREPKV